MISRACGNPAENECALSCQTSSYDYLIDQLLQIDFTCMENVEEIFSSQCKTCNP